MNLSRLLPLLAAPLALLADTVTLDNGDRLTGKVTQIHNGVLTIETAYAGSVAITQTNVVSMTVDAAVNVRTAEKVDERAGNLDTATLRDIHTLWLSGAEDPDVIPFVSPWNFSVAAEARHIVGNTHATLAVLHAEANYIRPEDYTLKLFAGAAYDKDGGIVAQHNFFGGADGSRFLSEHTGLYAREELLTDRVNDIKIRSTFGAGGEYFLYKNPVPGGLEMFRLRAGLGHRYERHRGVDASSDSVMTLDFGARFHKRLNDNLAWTTEITYAPAVDDFTNYLLTHDSRCGVDLVKKWNLSQEFGILHTYNSRPAAGKENLDTTCYARIKKSW